MSKLFEPLTVGSMSLNHRIVLAPLTRVRAEEPSLSPSRWAAEYYSQRASEGGLLITEATNINPDAVGTKSTPGIWTDEQVTGWKEVTEAVHKKSGRIVLQLWHTGRVNHSSLNSHSLLKGRGGPYSSSDVTCSDETPTYNGMEKCDQPKPLPLDMIPQLIEDYKRAARNAVAAGFDAVEVHAAHGYLLDQFIGDSANKRTDKYGGSIENRIRLTLEVVEAVVREIGAERVGIRLSPTTKTSMKFFGLSDSDPVTVYSALVKELSKFKLAYLFLSEPRWDPSSAASPEEDKGMALPTVNGETYRALWKGVLMGAGGFTPKTAKQALENGTYDLIAFGRWFISNPDLPDRIRTGAPLTVYNRDTFYAPTAEGYTDYPTIDNAKDSTYRLIDQDKIGQSLSDLKKN
eukprot:gene6341-9715_t